MPARLSFDVTSFWLLRILSNLNVNCHESLVGHTQKEVYQNLTWNLGMKYDIDLFLLKRSTLKINQGC